MSEMIELLKAPFDPKIIHWRVGARTADKSKGIALAYLNSRDVMKRLDDVCGSEGWQDRYPYAGCCEIGIRVMLSDIQGTPQELAWIWKSDGAGETAVEAEKGQFSDAFKRAAVKWGIGRYLYYLPNTWVPLTNNGQKLAEIPVLPSWAYPKEGE